MKKLFATFIAISLFASCGHEEEKSEAEKWLDQHFDYPVTISIKKDGIITSLLSTELTSGELPLQYSGSAKGLINQKEFLDIAERNPPKSDNLYVFVAFKDTTYNIVVSRANNNVTIE